MSKIILDYGPTNTGGTVTAKVFNTDASAQVGSDVSLSESLLAAAAGIYVGDIPAEMSSQGAGQYPVRFYSGTVYVTTASLFWGGTAEYTPVEAVAPGTAVITATVSS